MNLFAHSTHTYSYLFKPHLHMYVYYLVVFTDIYKVILNSDLLALLWGLLNEDF